MRVAVVAGLVLLAVFLWMKIDKVRPAPLPLGTLCTFRGGGVAGAVLLARRVRARVKPLAPPCLPLLQPHDYYLQSDSLLVTNLCIGCVLCAAMLACWALFFFRVYRWGGRLGAEEGSFGGKEGVKCSSPPCPAAHPHPPHPCAAPQVQPVSQALVAPPQARRGAGRLRDDHAGVPGAAPLFARPC